MSHGTAGSTWGRLTGLSNFLSCVISRRTMSRSMPARLQVRHPTPRHATPRLIRILPFLSGISSISFMIESTKSFPRFNAEYYRPCLSSTIAIETAVGNRLEAGCADRGWTAMTRDEGGHHPSQRDRLNGTSDTLLLPLSLWATFRNRGSESPRRGFLLEWAATVVTIFARLPQGIPVNSASIRLVIPL